MSRAKAKLTFKDKPALEQLEVAERLARGVAGDAALAERVKNLASLQEAIANARSLINAVEVTRSTLSAQVAQRDEALAAMRKQAGLVKSWVESEAKGDSSALMAAGLELVAEKHRIGLLPAPEGLSARPGRMTGTILLTWTHLPQRKPLYMVQVNTDQSDEAGWRQVTVTSRCKLTVTGLEAGRQYWFRMAAVGSAGAGPWCSPHAGRAA
jgi:hypothetical protein